MKRILLLEVALFAIVTCAMSQSMKVYQNGQLKAIYYVSKDDIIEFSDDFPFPAEPDGKDDKDVNLYNGHEYVDLGLSVKWATCNVGASKPEDYGFYYAWGEINDDDVYDWQHYDFYNVKTETLKKYYTDPMYGYLESPTLFMDDDVANVKWGGNWRMPTQEELGELMLRCSWEWKTMNGIGGHVITGVNGNSIFLPAAGYFYNKHLCDDGTDGAYWSNSIVFYSEDYAYGLTFNSTSMDSTTYVERFKGLPVRPVCP